MSTWTSFVKIWTVSNYEFNTNFLTFLGLYYLLFALETRIAQSVYFLREMCLSFNFWMIEFKIICFFDIHSRNFSSNMANLDRHDIFCLLVFWRNCVFWYVEDLRWKLSCVNVKTKHIIVNFFPSKSIQTEQS